MALAAPAAPSHRARAASVTLDLETGTRSGTPTIGGSGSVSYSPADNPATVTPLDGPGGSGYPAFGCSDPCVVAFDGGTGSGSAVAPRHDAHAPAANSTDAGTGCDFDGSGGNGSAISYITPGGSPGGPVQLLAATTATSTPVPLGTKVASGQAAYVTTGNSTLALALTPAGSSLLEQVKAADAGYWAVNPLGQSPPYAQLTLTLSFTPDASSSSVTTSATTKASSTSLPDSYVTLVVVEGVFLLAIAAITIRTRRAAKRRPLGFLDG